MSERDGVDCHVATALEGRRSFFLLVACRAVLRRGGAF
jgi:hypothetical protein